ncbi:hypothetical protein PInf_002441 [Phytophthora infestans]|nr:hypothetical protein PInf_002441 [Phytophthora infestans]
MPELEQLALGLTPGEYEENNTDIGLRIRLSPKAAKSGRPALSRTESEADDKKKQAVFNESEAHSRRLGEVTLVHLARCLQHEKPPLQDTLSRVLPLQTKYKNAGSKIPKYTRESAPLLDENALYLLQPKQLDTCVAVLRVSSTKESAIDVFTQNQTTQEDEEMSTIPGQNPEIDCVYIAGIGTFAREQIEAMAYLANVKRSCEEGVVFSKWLAQDAASAIPATQQSTFQSIADPIARASPQDTISIDGNDYHYAMLYRLKPPHWANDALILAFCARFLCVKQEENYEREMKTKVQELLTEADVLLIPVNFGNMHCCAIIVDGKQNNVLYYDLMNLKTYKSVLDRLSWDLATTLSDDSKVVSVNAPIQTNGYNCGFYVMLSSTSGRRQSEDLANQFGTIVAPIDASDSAPSLIPEKFKTYWMKIGWRRKRRSTGQRKSCFGKSTACTADIKAPAT